MRVVEEIRRLLSSEDKVEKERGIEELDDIRQYVELYKQGEGTISKR